MLGRREYQDAKTIPFRKKTAVTATLARSRLAWRAPATYYTVACRGWRRANSAGSRSKTRSSDPPASASGAS